MASPLADDATPADVTPARAPPNTPVVQLGDKDRPFCTGFFIGSGGHPGVADMVISAGHCIFETETPLDGLQVDVQGTAGLMGADLVEAGNRLGGMDDFSILRLRTVPADWKPDVLDCKYVPKVGDPLHIEGFPGAQPGAETYSEGYVNGATRPFFGADGWLTPVIPVTMPVAGGHSGSPVYEGDGRVIGILVGTNPAQPGWSYVQPITPVCNALHITA